MYNHYSWIIDGVLAQGGKPPIGVALYPKFTTLVITACEVVDDPEYRRRSAFSRVHVLHVPLDDHKPTRDELKMAIIASWNVTDRIRNGERVLTTCQQGRNRSGLVNAFTLINLGWTADQAIRQIKERRQDALTNSHFVRSIKGYAKLPKLAPARISA